MKNNSIMPQDIRWSNRYFIGSHKHHIYGGSNRKFSEQDGLFIYLTPEMHNMSNEGIHFNKEFMEYSKRVAEETWCKHYSKTKEDFIRRYGRNYL